MVSQKEAHKVLVFIADILESLRLQHWRVSLSDIPASLEEDDNTLASVHPTEGQYSASIRLGASWESEPDNVKVAALVHECCHLLHAIQVEVIRASLHASELLPEAVYKMMYEQFRIETERMVDHITQILMSNKNYEERWAEINNNWKRVKKDYPQITQGR